MRISNVTPLPHSRLAPLHIFVSRRKSVKVATLFKNKCSPEEIKERICDIAFNAMVKSAIYQDLNPADRAYGGFKKEMNGLPTFYICLRMVI